MSKIIRNTDPFGFTSVYKRSCTGLKLLYRYTFETVHPYIPVPFNLKEVPKPYKKFHMTYDYRKKNH